jgi:hypothetical protein
LPEITINAQEHAADDRIGRQKASEEPARVAKRWQAEGGGHGVGFATNLRVAAMRQKYSIKPNSADIEKINRSIENIDMH